MATTYEPIATITLSSSTDNITFSSIPSTYTDIKLVAFLISTGGSAQPSIRFNGDTGITYSDAQIRAIGSGTPSSGVDNLGPYIACASGGTVSSTTPSLLMVDIFSYANSSVKRSVLATFSNDKNGSGTTQINNGVWNNTASAINSITVYNANAGADDFAVGSVVTIYGILKA